MTNAIIIAHPDKVQQLFLLFHGLGDSAQGLTPLGHYLAGHFPQAAIVSINSPEPCDFASGYQWFSVQGITEENRSARMEAAMPQFIATVQHWQTQLNIAPQATALLGFSQGAMMALESTQQDTLLAGRIVAIAGRFAKAPQAPHQGCTIHLIHGKADSVVPYGYTVEAAERLIAQDADVTADVLPFIGHEINEDMARLIVERLSTYVPKRLWQEAMQSQANPQ